MLPKVRWIWIGRDEDKFLAFLQHPEVKKLDSMICEIVKHPCPCFPRTMLDQESGQQRIMEVELGDVFPAEVWKRQINQPASVGALHSHRRAWHVAETYSASDWAMFIEDDINLTANAADRVKMVFDFIEEEVTSHGQYHMVNFVMGASPYMVSLAEKYSKRLHRDGRQIEIRTCPIRQTRWHEQQAIHVGLGLKWYALSGQARRFLLGETMRYEAYELYIMSMLMNGQHFVLPGTSGVPSHRPGNRVLYVTPTCGEHARDFDDFFIGSGRYKRDSGHDAGPYVMVAIPATTKLIPRLHMVAFGAELARIARIGLVIHWPTSNMCCKFWFQDMFRWGENVTKHGIAFVRILSQDKGGTVTYYTKAADPKRYRLITLDFEIDYLEGLRGLLRVPDQSFRQRLKSLLQVQLMARELELQPWCHQAARDWLWQNELEELRRDGTHPLQCSLHLWTAGDGDDENEFRQKGYEPAMSWMEYMTIATEAMLHGIANGERVVFVTNEMEHLDNNGFRPWRDLAIANAENGRFVTWPNIQDLDTIGTDEYYQTESTATFMALLQQLDLALFPSVCTFLHSHVLWADIVGSDPHELVEWLDNVTQCPESPFKSFAGKNRSALMKQGQFQPPWKKQRVNPLHAQRLDELWAHLHRMLPEHVCMNDTIFKYITRAQYAVLLEIRETTLDTADRHIELTINADANQKMSMQALGTWAQNFKDLTANKNKYRESPLPSEPRTAWPWLTAMILVVLNQYRIRTGRNPYHIHNSYITLPKEWDGNLEALYDSRGPGSIVSAGLFPKTGGCPKLR